MPESINEQKEWKGSDFLLTNVSKMTFFFTSVTQKPSSHLVTVAQVLMKSNFVSKTHIHVTLGGPAFRVSRLGSKGQVLPDHLFPTPKSPNRDSKGSCNAELAAQAPRGVWERKGTHAGICDTNTGTFCLMEKVQLWLRCKAGYIGRS